jgi:hypothetical protein
MSDRKTWIYMCCWAFMMIGLVVNALLGATGALQSRDTLTHSRQCNERLVENTTEVNQLRHQLSTSTAVEVIRLKVMVLNRNIEPALAHEIALAIQKYASQFGMDPDLVLSIIKNESNFDPEAVSRMKALGLMQVFPSWQKTSCEGLNLLEVADNIHCGIKIYSFYEDAYVKMPLTLSVYNRGPNPVDHDLANGEPGVNEYATRVLTTYNKLKAIGGAGAGSEENRTSAR